MVAADSIPKPSLNVFRVLHKLGDRRIAVASESALATATASDDLVIALWDYAPPTGIGPTYTMQTSSAGPAKTFELELKNVPANAAIELWRVDEDHGNVLKEFNAMGRPPGDLTQEQIKTLRAAGEMAPAEHLHLKQGRLQVTVPAYGLALVVVAR